MVKNNILAAIAAAVLSVTGIHAQGVVDLGESGEDGKYTLRASVNGVGVKTYYTPENWFVSLSSRTYLFLYENGYIADADVKGFTVLKMPGGPSERVASFVIRELRVDDVIVKDVPAFVFHKQIVPLLIGNSAFESLGDVVREGNRITIGDLRPTGEGTDALAPADSLKLAAQDFMDAGEYASAAACLGQLYSSGTLNMLTHYQYAVLLNMLGRDSENIVVSHEWLSSNEGKSLTMDYWIHNGLGASHARLGDNAKAIESFEKAIGAYCRLYNTSEKGIKAGNFQDQDMGATLYSLGRVYAAEGKVSKAESRCSLAAKCGYQPAIDFCKQFKIKY